MRIVAIGFGPFRQSRGGRQGSRRGLGEDRRAATPARRRAGTPWAIASWSGVTGSGRGLVRPDVVLELGPELGDRVLDRPGGAVGQAADRRPGHDAHVVGHLEQDVEVLDPAAAGLDPLDRLVHPAGPLAAGGALAAALVGEEPRGVVEVVDDARLVVDHGHGGGPQAEAAGLAEALEVERGVELVGREQAHADPARARRPWPSAPSRRPPACSSIRSRQVTPSGSSTQTCLLTWPETQ